MANIIIIHCTRGSPDSHWLPWLKEELGKSGHDIIIPKFPTPDGQNLGNWLEAFMPYEKYLTDGSILIGHSIGCAFALNLIERTDANLEACFLVAGFIEDLENSTFTPLNHTFYENGFDWTKIRTSCKNFYIYGSDNDPHVSLRNIHSLSSKLGTKEIIVNNAGHFNTASGYVQFPLLLEDIKKHLNSKSNTSSTIYQKVL